MLFTVVLRLIPFCKELIGSLCLGIVQIQSKGQVSRCQANAFVTAGLYPHRHVELARLFQHGGLFFVRQQPNARVIVVNRKGSIPKGNVADPTTRIR